MLVKFFLEIFRKKIFYTPTPFVKAIYEVIRKKKFYPPSPLRFGGPSPEILTLSTYDANFETIAEH
jgi:hypothetical protein